MIKQQTNVYTDKHHDERYNWIMIFHTSNNFHEYSVITNITIITFHIIHFACYINFHFIHFESYVTPCCFSLGYLDEFTHSHLYLIHKTLFKISFANIEVFFVHQRNIYVPEYTKVL